MKIPNSLLGAEEFGAVRGGVFRARYQQEARGKDREEKGEKEREEEVVDGDQGREMTEGWEREEREGGRA